MEAKVGSAASALGQKHIIWLFWGRRMEFMFPKPMCNRAMHPKVQRDQPPRLKQLLQSSEGRNQNNPSGVRTSHTRARGKATPKLQLFLEDKRALLAPRCCPKTT